MPAALTIRHAWHARHRPREGVLRNWVQVQKYILTTFGPVSPAYLHQRSRLHSDISRVPRTDSLRWWACTGVSFSLRCSLCILLCTAAVGPYPCITNLAAHFFFETVMFLTSLDLSMLLLVLATSLRWRKGARADPSHVIRSGGAFAVGPKTSTRTMNLGELWLWDKKKLPWKIRQVCVVCYCSVSN